MYRRFRRRLVVAACLVIVLTACAGSINPFDDPCALRPVSARSPLHTAFAASVAYAATCGAMVEVNGDARYAPSPGTGFVVDDADLEPFGVVTAANTGQGGEVFALRGVDPRALLAMRPHDAPHSYIPLWALDEAAPRGSAFPEGCRYFTSGVEDYCES